MRLEVKEYHVSDVVFGAKTAYDQGLLTINEAEINEKGLVDCNNIKLKVHIAKPNESVRITHIMDTVKPVYKPNGSTFPGVINEKQQVGSGITHALSGVCVMQTCSFPGVQEGFIDMSGPSSKFSVFAQKINIVLEIIIINENVTKEDFAREVKSSILRVSEFLAQTTLGEEANATKSYELASAEQDLPKIGYIYYIQAQGPLRNVHIYGEDCTAMQPRKLHPNEVIDGALVSGNYIIACQKNPTIFHQDNPVILDLYRRDGKELYFGGVIFSTESSSLAEKQNNARMVAQFAQEMGLDGVIISQEGGGHADVDLMESLKECEKLGIKSVILTNEIAGPRGDLPPLVATVPEANAIVTNGNNDEIYSMPAVERVIGGLSILKGKYNAKDAFETSLGIYYTSTNQLGMNKMTTIKY